MSPPVTSSELSCSLNDDSYKDRRRFVRASLLPHIKNRQFTDTGVDLVFAHSTEIVANLELFISLEKQCCGFLDFVIIQHPEEVTLTIKGPAAGQQVIKKFLHGLSKAAIS